MRDRGRIRGLAPRWRGAVAAALASTAVSLVVPAVAEGNIVTSHNWSGYAVHKSGLHFERASASWRQPSASCSGGTARYSAFWVGIGGYRLSSQSLEQIGTELDCKRNGTQSITAWYELVPRPDHTIRMTIGSGDLITASVAVSGRRVTLALADVSRGESFVKTITARKLDTTSAEWIAEAPSTCTTAGKCETLPLTDFGSIGFTGASAVTGAGTSGSISSSLWAATKILLGYARHGAAFIARTATAHASPSTLVDGGHGFTVAYSPASGGESSGGGGGSGAGGSGPSGSGGGPGGGGPGGGGPGGGGPAGGGPGGGGPGPGGGGPP